MSGGCAQEPGSMLRKLGLGLGENARDCDLGAWLLLPSQLPGLHPHTGYLWVARGRGGGEKMGKQRHLPFGGSTELGSGDLCSSFLFHYNMK